MDVSLSLEFSIVTTPSFPTALITSETNLPISSSLLADIVATCCSLSELISIASDCSLRDSTTLSTALSIPRFKSIGLAPSLTSFNPSVIIA